MKRLLVLDHYIKDVRLVWALQRMVDGGFIVEFVESRWMAAVMTAKEIENWYVATNDAQENLLQSLVGSPIDENGLFVVLGTPVPTQQGTQFANHIRALALRTPHSRIYIAQDLADVESLRNFDSLDEEAKTVLCRDLARKALWRTAQFDEECGSLLQQGAYPAPEPARVLVLGGGGREHAIVSSLALSSAVGMVIVSPGNSGTAMMGHSARAGPAVAVVNVPTMSVEDTVAFALSCRVNLVIVGPEQPLVEGIADALQEKSIPCFGPSAAASRIEASKAWAKEFMRRHSVPTAESRSFADAAAAEAYILQQPHAVVVKASGLAEGKGVYLPDSAKEAVTAARALLEEGVRGPAGAEIVVERRLAGEEVSVLAFCDGKSVVGMPPAQDHKRAYDYDEGPNTGGMGAFAPSSLITPRQYQACLAILQRVVDGLAAEGAPFVGVLYGGFMLTDEGPMVLEFNCRFGDPEAQALLPLLEGDLYRICLSCAQGTLQPDLVRWRDSCVACAVVCAQQWYPDGPRPTPTDPPVRIQGWDRVPSLGCAPFLRVFLAGATAVDESRPEEGVVATGGRVLAVTGLGSTLQEARKAAYEGVSVLGFDGMRYRRDIGNRALSRPLRVGVLGSTKGTSLQAVIDAIEAGALNARIVLVVSNKPEAVILHRAAEHGIPAACIPPEPQQTREDYDTRVMAALDQEGVDVVLMVGYMRIASDTFVRHYRHRCINVHPSLLPDFAAGMDLHVHSAVLAAGKPESGCTVHFVSEQVDAGPIILQKRCTVSYPSETADTLKAKVQALEGVALVEALQMFVDGSISRVTEVPDADRVRAVSVSAPEVLRITHKDGEVTYKEAGVDIAAGEALVRAIKPFCRDTHRPGSTDIGLEGFGAAFDLAASGYQAANSLLVAGTDGVGTKLLVAQAVGKHDTIGVDLVAMSANDVLACGAEPLFFLDYFATGRLDVETAAQVVQGIAKGCRYAGAALIGGETAEMAGLYQEGEYDLAGFCVGAVRGQELLPRREDMVDGDVLVALRSSGLHSNGYSLVRRCVELTGLRYEDPPPFDSPFATLGDALLVPTRIYVRDLLPLLRRRLVKGMAHITGGGILGNLPRALPPDLRAVVHAAQSDWQVPPVFRWLQRVANLSERELLRTFNCGIGMVLVVDRALVPEVMATLAGSTSDAFVLGNLRPRPGPRSPREGIPGPDSGESGDGTAGASQVVIVGAIK